jgi:hypothetical protein
MPKAILIIFLQHGFHSVQRLAGENSFFTKPMKRRIQLENLFMTGRIACSN